MQNAYGLGSGNMAQQQLARALGMTDDLTNLRNVYAANTANRGQKQFVVGENYRDAIAGVVTVVVCGAIIFMNFQFEALI